MRTAKEVAVALLQYVQQHAKERHDETEYDWGHETVVSKFGNTRDDDDLLGYYYEDCADIDDIPFFVSAELGTDCKFENIKIEMPSKAECAELGMTHADYINFCGEFMAAVNSELNYCDNIKFNFL